MTVYGTRIKSDIDFPLDLSDKTETQYETSLSSKVPLWLKQAITCGFPLYLAHGRKVYLYSNRLFDGSEVSQPWCYEVEDVVTFYWVGGETTVYYEFGEKGDAYLLAFWFIHLFFPFYLTLEEKYDFFHAGAVEVGGNSICFIAPSMGGKSTLTDYFIRQGHTLVSDDKVATFIQNGKCMAVGSHPYHRPYRKFEELGYRVKNFSRSFKPIQAFYKLEKAAFDAEVKITEIRGFEKFDMLLPHYLYMFPWLKVQRLKYLSQVFNTVQVFHVIVPWDIKRLPEVYEIICTNIKYR